MSVKHKQLKYDQYKIPQGVVSIDGGMSFDEIRAVCAVIESVNAGTVLELGTYMGATCWTIQHNFPSLQITTVNIPNGATPKLGCDRDNAKYFGAQIFPGLPAGIRMVACDTAEFNTQEKFDVVIVDACHTEAYCENDTKVALGCASRAILWHDYAAHCWPGVSAVVDRLSESIEIFRLSGTSLACAWLNVPEV
jgi:hypothetical protein